jgi:hypothetical protein
VNVRRCIAALRVARLLPAPRNRQVRRAIGSANRLAPPQAPPRVRRQIAAAGACPGVQPTRRADRRNAVRRSGRRGASSLPAELDAARQRAPRRSSSRFGSTLVRRNPSKRPRRRAVPPTSAPMSHNERATRVPCDARLRHEWCGDSQCEGFVRKIEMRSLSRSPCAARHAVWHCGNGGSRPARADRDESVSS